MEETKSPIQDTKAATSNVMVSNIKEDYAIVQGVDGKYIRRAIYKPYSSVHPTTREQKIAMLNLLNSDDEALPMADYVGTKIALVDVIFNPYDAVDEDTGELTNGVLSYLFDISGKVYVTSSKSVYFSLKRVFMVFGEPHYTNDEAVTVEVQRKDGPEHKYIDLKIIG